MGTFCYSFQDTGRQICRVVIAGNTLSKDTQDKESEKVVCIIFCFVSAKSNLNPGIINRWNRSSIRIDHR